MLVASNIDNGFRALQGKCMVEGMTDCTLDFDICEHCIYEKQNRVRFASSATRAKGTIKSIHSDLFGHVHVPSLGKFVYYVSSIVDFLRKTWVYFLCNKF